MIHIRSQKKTVMPLQINATLNAVMSEEPNIHTEIYLQPSCHECLYKTLLLLNMSIYAT